MASRATIYYLRNMVKSSMGKNRSFMTSTLLSPRMMKAAYVQPRHGNYYSQQNQTNKPRSMDRNRMVVKGEFFPVYVAVGLIACSLTFGAYTAEHHLRYNPTVRLKKKKRETIPEVVDPDGVVKEADGFINKSWFRKVAHVQEFHHAAVVPDPIRGDIYTRPKKAETLKSVIDE